MCKVTILSGRPGLSTKIALRRKNIGKRRSEGGVVEILLEQVKSKKTDLGVNLTYSEERTQHTLRFAYLDSIEKFAASALLV